MIPPRTGLTWQKSSYSGTETNCVEVADDKDRAHVRDSKLVDASPVLSFADGAWARFLNRVSVAED